MKAQAKTDYKAAMARPISRGSSGLQNKERSEKMACNKDAKAKDKALKRTPRPLKKAEADAKAMKK